ncbi:MAG: FAD-dependent oxidoreductase [Bacteroides sp.]|jgi:glycine/D-amino acid oxidase-like deaminating enzyme/Fe-S-cluster-containing hydrogenase component 2|nr:FAD-dependent oxidoreductase [Bacteroides sp.]
MHKITKHPIIPIADTEKVTFKYNGIEVTGEKGFTIAAALHQAGFPVHSHSLTNRNRSLECGIGKCGACEMLVDGEIRRICITPVDGIREVKEIPRDYVAKPSVYVKKDGVRIFKTDVVIVGAGPAGLATREILLENGISNIVIDSNAQIGGQFNMQTHQFFFFEKEKKYGGLRGFEIAKTLAGENHDGILLNSTVWDIFEGNRIAIKNFRTQEIFYVDCEHLVVATGAVPFLPTFHNDDLPGVYTAAVIQKMMNTELTLLGKNILTVGAGNIGYLTSYQLIQAGAKVKAIIEAQSHEGGFPVQANRVRRLGIPILLSHMILEAIPNENGNGIKGAVIAKAENFNPIPGTEMIIEGIDAINICTGLMPDNALLEKGQEMFGRKCYGAGDAIRIGEGTSAVLKGKQVAYEILESMGRRFNYDDFLLVSKEYIDSQQHPIRVIEKPVMPEEERMAKPFVQIDCLYGFACNPCAFACKYGAITKTSTSTVPHIDFDKCVGCMDCVYQCPGLAIFGYNPTKNTFFLPIEFDMSDGEKVYLVDNDAKILGEGYIDKILRKKNLTHVARVKSNDMPREEQLKVRGFIIKRDYPEKLDINPYEDDTSDDIFMCHCDDVPLKDVLEVIGDRKFVSVEEVKHTTHLGMGPCRGKRCLQRLKQNLRPLGVELIGGSTPRAPMSNQISIGELFPASASPKIITNFNGKGRRIVEVKSLVAGGGIGGSALFRFLAEEGYEPVLINSGFGSSWRNIAGGRPAFSLPELSDIARHNQELFVELQKHGNIDFRQINYVTFAHDEAMYKALEESMAWQNAVMLDPSQFRAEISPFFNEKNDKYIAAMKTSECWQATPGKVIELLRKLGVNHGGTLMEDCKLINVEKYGDRYQVIVRDHKGEYIEYRTTVFVNALGSEGNHFARMLDIETGLYPVKHQAFITRRLPMLGIGGRPLDMLIDRRNYKGFVAVYGQQLGETGQIIGCASPAVEPLETDKNLKVNSKDFAEIVSEIFIDWIPEISSVGFQALWAGYYIEPRMIIDVEKGLFLGLRGQGFMLGQYLAKLYVDQLTGKEVPEYFDRLKLGGDALLEKAFK